MRHLNSSAAKPGLIIYCNLSPQRTSITATSTCASEPSGSSGSHALGAEGSGTASAACCEYNPYSLVVVDRTRADPRHHYIMTQSGTVTHMLGGQLQELLSFHAWQRERDLFTVLRKLVFFKRNELCQVGGWRGRGRGVLPPTAKVLGRRRGGRAGWIQVHMPRPQPCLIPWLPWLRSHDSCFFIRPSPPPSPQAFWQWRDAVRLQKFRARQRQVARDSLLLNPLFHRPLLNIRRMTLAAASDTHGTWRKTHGAPQQDGLPALELGLRRRMSLHVKCSTSTQCTSR